METTKGLIALEASGLLRPSPTGIGVYGRGLTRALQARDPNGYGLIAPWGRWRLRRLLADAVPDLPVHFYASGGRLGRNFRLVHALDTRLPGAYPGPLVATIYDTLALLPLSAELGLSTATFRERKRRAYREIAAKAEAVITLSEAVRDEVVSRLAPRAPVIVVPPGVSPLRPAPARQTSLWLLEAEGIRPPFLLAVGALCQRKNIEAAVRAFESVLGIRPGLKLVLAGPPDADWGGSRGDRAVQRSKGPIILAGYLRREVLWAAYASAEAVVHLSHYEGYGLTVLEALAAGAPVVASSRGGIPEAAGGAAWLVDPGREDEAAAALRRILEQDPEVDARRRKGLLVAAARTWERAAARVEELYREILGS